MPAIVFPTPTHAPVLRGCPHLVPRSETHLCPGRCLLRLRARVRLHPCQVAVLACARVVCVGPLALAALRRCLRRGRRCAGALPQAALGAGSLLSLRGLLHAAVVYERLHGRELVVQGRRPQTRHRLLERPGARHAVRPVALSWELRSYFLLHTELLDGRLHTHRRLLQRPEARDAWPVVLPWEVGPCPLPVAGDDRHVEGVRSGLLIVKVA
mmetsp:Transcript_4147/g.14504  ORF Transcript_4147/g.14504 Transcript_4147/m.14504 type:complete len:212 (+) Transcript_4147:779-1414(+)